MGDVVGNTHAAIPGTVGDKERIVLHTKDSTIRGTGCQQQPSLVRRWTNRIFDRYTPKTFLFSSVLRPNQRYHNEIKVLLFGRVLHCVTFSTMSDDGPPFVTVRIQFV